MHRSLLGGILGLALIGCASGSMNKSECLVSDWQMIGYEDGARGHRVERLGMHRKACAEHGIAPDLEAYRKGRWEGLQEYCQPTRGYALGNRGGRYAGVCPASLEPDFLAAYDAGHQLHTLRASVAHAKSRLKNKRRSLERLQQELVNKETALVADGITSNRRLALLVEINDLFERRGQLQAEIEDLIVESSQREEDLYAYKAELDGDY